MTIQVMGATGPRLDGTGGTPTAGLRRTRDLPSRAAVSMVTSHQQPDHRVAFSWITGQTACSMNRPDTRYVPVGDADVAYQVLGEGPSDLLFFNGLGNHIEMAWENPDIADFLRQLASLRRLILLDRRGTGASDGVPRNAIPTWEEWTEDIESVLNEVGSEQSSILAAVDGGPIAVLYAATHPERVDSLVLCNTSARYLVADDYPIGFTPEALDFVVEFIRTHWGTPEFLSVAGASRRGRRRSSRCPGTALQGRRSPREPRRHSTTTCFGTSMFDRCSRSSERPRSS